MMEASLDLVRIILKDHVAAFWVIGLLVMCAIFNIKEVIYIKALVCVNCVNFLITKY